MFQHGRLACVCFGIGLDDHVHQLLLVDDLDAIQVGLLEFVACVPLDGARRPIGIGDQMSRTSRHVVVKFSAGRFDDLNPFGPSNG